MAIVRSLDNSWNSQKTILVGDHKNDKPKEQKNEKSIFVIGDSMVKHLMDGKCPKNWTQIVKCLLKPFQVQKQHVCTIR